ncbi:class I SAM-dependent methyltransferase [Nocardioides acrostichi]|uniref:Class I SAM-dependent methyltransferase n=1 Tax=Nocardioides acrostichi TaxID=2784339 RepID=A0A930V179_9ACTN|nr:class I SAM-dependent methyltransferase [Nocardioides acrostichi]MBF4162001.1 class I SAM-dependent methyltransferase [Nocardioides acrostichi]
MGFFDFLDETQDHKYAEANIARLNARFEMIVEPYRRDLEDARVLDLASHDGRWAYALSGAGAREVVGIEGRQDLIDQFESSYPRGEIADRVHLQQGDIFETLPTMVERGERFDVVAVFGIFYHIMEHYRLLKLIKHVGARLAVIDSEFIIREGPFIRIGEEETSKELNSIPHEQGQDRAPVGVPSREAVERMADTLGYDTAWTDWSARRADQRRGLRDYYRTDHWKRRGTCALRLR